MTFQPSVQQYGIAALCEDGQYRWAAGEEQADGSAIIKVFTGGTPELSDNGAVPVEMEGTYTDYESEIPDVDGGSPVSVFSVAADGRTQAIKRVVAEFGTADGSNTLEVVVVRTVGVATRTFTLYALADPLKTDFFVEGHTLIRPGEEVRIQYAGPMGNDLWVCITTQDV